MANVYLLGVYGQSNANGNGMTVAGLSTNYPNLTNWPAYSTSYNLNSSSTAGIYDGGVKIWNRSTVAWQNLSQATGTTNLIRLGLSCQLPIAAHMINRWGAGNCYVVNAANDSTPLAANTTLNNWSVEDYSNSTRGLLKKFLDDLVNAATNLTSAGHTVHIVGLFCVQGEQDSWYADWAYGYKYNKLNQLARINDRLNLTDGNGIWCGTAHPTIPRNSTTAGTNLYNNQYGYIVRQGITDAITAYQTIHGSNRASVITTYDIFSSTLINADELHWSSSGTEEVVNRWFTAYDSVVSAGYAPIVWSGSTNTTFSTLPTFTEVTGLSTTYSVGTNITATLSANNFDAGDSIADTAWYDDDDNVVVGSGASLNATPSKYNGHVIRAWYKNNKHYHAQYWKWTHVLAPRTNITSVGTPKQWMRAAIGASLDSNKLVTSIPNYTGATSTVLWEASTGNAKPTHKGLALTPSDSVRAITTTGNTTTEQQNAALDDTSSTTRIIKFTPHWNTTGITVVYGSPRVISASSSWIGIPAATGVGNNTDWPISLYRNNSAISSLVAGSDYWGADESIIVASVKNGTTHTLYRWDGSSVQTVGSATATVTNKGYPDRFGYTTVSNGFEGLIEEAIGYETALNTTQLADIFTQLAANDIPSPISVSPSGGTVTIQGNIPTVTSVPTFDTNNDGVQWYTTFYPTTTPISGANTLAIGQYAGGPFYTAWRFPIALNSGTVLSDAKITLYYNGTKSGTTIPKFYVEKVANSASLSNDIDTRTFTTAYTETPSSGSPWNGSAGYVDIDITSAVNELLASYTTTYITVIAVGDPATSGGTGWIQIADSSDGAINDPVFTYTESANVNVVPTGGTVSFVGNTPTVFQGKVFAPTTGTITFTGNTPTAGYTGDYTANVNQGSVAFTGNTPTVSSRYVPLAVSRTLAATIGGDGKLRSADTGGAFWNGAKVSSTSVPVVTVTSTQDTTPSLGSTVQVTYASTYTGHWEIASNVPGGTITQSSNGLTATITFVPSASQPAMSIYVAARCVNSAGTGIACCRVHPGMRGVIQVGAGRAYSTLTAAFAAVKAFANPGGYAFVIKDGTYSTLDMGMAYDGGTTHLPPSGEYTTSTQTDEYEGGTNPKYTITRFTSVMAETPFGVIYDLSNSGFGAYNAGLHIHGGTDLEAYEYSIGFGTNVSVGGGSVGRGVHIAGFVSKNTTSSGFLTMHADHVFFEYVFCGEVAGNTENVNMSCVQFQRSTDCLAENIHSVGGGRYKQSVYESKRCVFRRCFSRFDHLNTKEPHAAISLYRPRDMVVQNTLTFDSDNMDEWDISPITAVLGEAARSQDAGMLAIPSTGVYDYPRNIKFRRNLGYNNDLGLSENDARYIPTSFDTGFTFHDVGMWYYKPQSGGAAGCGISQDGPSTFTRLTSINCDTIHTQYGINAYRKFTKVSNSVLLNYGHDYDNNPRSVSDTFLSGQGGHTAEITNSDVYNLNTGTLQSATDVVYTPRTNVNPLTQGLRYPGRIEDSSNYKTSGWGQDSWYKSQGVRGTFYGETGYLDDVNDNWLAQAMLEYALPHYRAYSRTGRTISSPSTPLTRSGDRGGVVTTKNLIDYIISNNGKDIPFVNSFHAEKIDSTTTRVSWRIFASDYVSNLTAWNIYIDGELAEQCTPTQHSVDFINLISGRSYQIRVSAVGTISSSTVESGYSYIFTVTA